MRMITVVCCTLLASTLLCAQSGSNSNWDSTWWNGLPEAVKIGFVIGWTGARGATAVEECANDPALSAHFSSCVDKQFKFLQIPSDYTMSQFEDGRDKLVPVCDSQTLAALAHPTRQQVRG